MTALGRTTKLGAIIRLWERGTTEDAHRPSRNMFDRLGQSREENMRTYLEARRTSVTSRRRGEEPVVSLINDEINDLRARLEKLETRNREVPLSTSTSLFSTEIQQASLPVCFRIPTMTIYEGKADPLDHLDAFNDQRDLLQVITLARCRCFAITLSGTAKKWIHQVESETVVSWGNC